MKDATNKNALLQHELFWKIDVSKKHFRLRSRRNKKKPNNDENKNEHNNEDPINEQPK